MIRFIITFSFILCVVLFIGVENTHAAEKIIILTEQFPPFNFKEGDTVQGLSTQIVRKLLERANLEFSIELVPWKRAYTIALNRPNTLIYTIAKTASREGKFHWIGKISNRKVSLFRLRSRQDLAKLTFEQAKAKAKIATIQGDASTEKIFELGFAAKNITEIHDTATNSLCMKHVIGNRSDYFPMNPYSLKYRIEAGEVQDLFVDQFVIWDADGYYVAANIRTDPKILKALTESYQQLRQEGFINKVVDEYANF